MKIGKFRLCSAKTIRELTPLLIANADVLKENSVDKVNVNINKDIDIHAVLRNYQELYFLT